MPTKRPPILPGEPLCACVPQGTPADDFEMFIQLCPCMYTETNGIDMCNQCGQSIHFCPCALVHSSKCEDA